MSTLLEENNNSVRAGESATFSQGLFFDVLCVFSRTLALVSVRIPGGVAHIEIGVEVNKREYGPAMQLKNSVRRVRQHSASLLKAQPRNSATRCHDQVKLFVIPSDSCSEHTFINLTVRRTCSLFLNQL